MDNYNILTEAARAALDNSVEEIKDMILNKAYQNASIQNCNAEISLQDILKAKKSILNQNNTLAYRERKKRRLAILFSIAGFVYAICGILLYIYQNLNIDIEKDFGLIIASIGTVISITGMITVQLSYKSKSPSGLLDYHVLEYELIKKWNKIESLGVELMKKDGVLTKETKSINSIIEFILVKLSSDIEQSKLKNLIVTRNSIVHNSEHVSTKRIMQNIETANEIIYLLEHQIL